MRIDKRQKAIKRINLIILMMMAVMIAFPESALAIDIGSQEIKFDKILNARDMGGYKTKDGRVVKKGVLIRSGELSYATKKDLNRLKTEYNVKKVIDFRYKSDYKYCPDKKISGIKYINLPASYSKSHGKKTPKKRYRKFRNKGKKKLRAKAIPTFGKAKRSYTYKLVMSSHSKKMYRKYFNQLLANESGDGVVIHCIYGKDRTGVAAFMTLVALGVDEKTAYNEYALTNSYLKKYGKKRYSKGNLGVRKKDLKYAVGKAKKKYGSLDRFLYKAYGLDAAKLKKLRSIYTE